MFIIFIDFLVNNAKFVFQLLYKDELEWIASITVYVCVTYFILLGVRLSAELNATNERYSI